MAMCLKSAAIVVAQEDFGTDDGQPSAQLRKCVAQLAQVDTEMVASVSGGVVVLLGGDETADAMDAVDVESAIAETCASASVSASVPANAETRDCCFALGAAVPTGAPRTVAPTDRASQDPSAQESAAASAAAEAMAEAERVAIQDSLGSAAGTAGGIAGALLAFTALAIIFAQWKKRQGSAPLQVIKDPRSGGGAGSKKKASAVGTPQRKAVSFVNPAYAAASGNNQTGRITPGFAHLSEENAAGPSLDDIEKGYLAIGEEGEDEDEGDNGEHGYIQVGNPLFVSTSPPTSPLRSSPTVASGDAEDYE